MKNMTSPNWAAMRAARFGAPLDQAKDGCLDQKIKKPRGASLSVRPAIASNDMGGPSATIPAEYMPLLRMTEINLLIFG